MSDLPGSADRFLRVLVSIENAGIAQAQERGCKCSAPAPTGDRNYPFAVFNTAQAVGKPPDLIHWKMEHEPGCLMDGQEGTGWKTD
jgi:hypothetical protein